jgi:hypothetical protein
LYALSALCFYLVAEGITHLRGVGSLPSGNKVTEGIAEELYELKAQKEKLLLEHNKLQELYDANVRQKAVTRDVLPQPLSGSALSGLADTQLNYQAVVLLGLFQQKGRLIDFLMQDITVIDDNRIGSVARIVHQGCKKVIDEHFTIVPISTAPEGENVKIEPPFKPSFYRLSGKVTNESTSYTGKVVHRGWKSTAVKLPKPIDNDDLISDLVITPAEVECV